MIDKVKSNIRKIHENFFGTENYVKFVIITRSRTGSNFLISLLRSNKNIRAYGEKFNFLKGKNCNSIFKEIYPTRSYKTIGFKIFYYHPIDSEDKTIWDLIKNDENIKIIHLQRKNLLRVHISRLIAGKTKRWSTFKKDEIKLDNKKVTIDFQKLIDDINYTKNCIIKVNTDYKKNRILNIFYEELVNDKSTTLNRIYKFLGLPYHEPSSKMKKQNPEKIKELIVNFDDIKKKLKNTPYSYMLND